MHYYLDTNVVLRLLIAENLKVHQDCKELFQAIETGKITVCLPSICLAEVVWTLQSFYGFPKTEVADVVTRIVHLPHLTIQDQTDYYLVLELMTINSIKFTDACIAVQSGLQSESAQLISYDRDFDKLDINRVEPSQVLKEL